MKMIYEKWPSKKLLTMTFEHLSQVLTLRTLGSLCINSLENGRTDLPEILTSTYEMKLKLGPAIKGDDTWQHVIYGPETFLK